MTVDELLNTMTKEFRQSLWDVSIDDDEVGVAAASTVKSEVHHWYIAPPYTTGLFFVIRMCIYTRQYVIESDRE